MDSTLQRIDQVLELYGTNRTKFSQKIGMSQSTLSCIFARGEGKSIQPVAEAALQVFADVRPQWLLHGEEPMLKSQLTDQGTEKLIDIIASLSETIRQQQIVIGNLTK